MEDTELREWLSKITAQKKTKRNTIGQAVANTAKTGSIAFVLFKIFEPIILAIEYILIYLIGGIIATPLAVRKFMQERFINNNKDFRFSLNWGAEERAQREALNPAPKQITINADTMFKDLLKRWTEAGQPLPSAGKQLELKEAVEHKFKKEN